MTRLYFAVGAVVVATQAIAQATTPPPPGAGALSLPNADPFPSTYVPYASRPTVIRNVTIMTAAGPAIRNGAILLQGGKITAVGTTVSAPGDAVVIDGTGKYVTPGIIDVHSHLGVYPAPGVAALSDGNEATDPVTANVWAEHSVWPQDPQFPRNLAGGVTTLQVLPGSANLIGGRSAILKVVPSRSVQGMKFPGAKYGLKMACGENPKRVYGNRGPSTRMGNVAGYRNAWINAEA
jgi:imidazolonepropionase-like amidohydrolase